MNRLGLLLLYPLLVLALAFTALRYLAAVIKSPDKAWSIAFMIDETANVDANGRIDETISARAARARYRGKAWGCILCWILDRIQRNHCEDALEHDDARD